MSDSTNTERGAVIEIGGESYTLILTTKATKAISGKYGGLDVLGEQLMRAENYELALTEIVWLVTLLANQSVMINNLKHPDSPRVLLTEDMVDLLTTPFELATYREAVTAAIFMGTRRDVESEEDPNSKNVRTTG